MKTFGMDAGLGTRVFNMNVSLTLMIGVHPTQFRLLASPPSADRTLDMLPSVRGPCDLEGEILQESDGNPRVGCLLLAPQGALRGSLVDTAI